MFRLVEGGKLLPQRATRFSAGFDVFAREDVVIGAGETKLIGLGIALDGWVAWDVNTPIGEQTIDLDFLQDQYYFMLCLRSSLGAKGLILPNGHGVIDMDYRDEIKMIIHNPLQSVDVFNGNTNDDYRVQRGDKIGQLILCRHEGYLLPAEYTLDAERNGGFGSTDA